MLVSLDKTTGTRHAIGSTNYLYATNPIWGKVLASEESKRLKHLLPNNGDGGFFDTSRSNETADVDFPILQPISLTRGEIPTLIPWDESPGAIVFEVKFQDTISFLPGSEYTIGEVVVPLSKLSQHKELSGWFQVLEVGGTRMVALGSRGTADTNDVPQICIRITWSPPRAPVGAPSDTEREASFVIQEELLRSALAMKDRKLGFVGSSLGALNTVRGLSDNLLLVQNTLGSVLDLIGSIRSVFNFSVSRRGDFIA